MIRSLDPRPPGRASELAERFGTPLYAFDGARMEAEARAFMEVAGPDVTVAYSVKSNPLMGLVARLHRAGCWAEVASGFEYRVARRAGVPGSQTVFNGPLKTKPSSAGRWRGRHRHRGRPRAGPRDRPPGRPRRARRARRPAPAPAGPRAHRPLRRPGAPRAGGAVGAAPRRACGSPACTSTWAPTSSARCRPAGPPIHGVTVQYPVPVALRRRRRAAARDGRAVGGVEWLDMGGGWPARGRLGPYLDAVREALGPGRPAARLEPGRALIRDAGWLLTRVVARRGRPGAVVVDAGITQVPCVLWKRSPVEAAEPRAGAERPTDLFGPLCLQHDAIAREVPLPPLRVGDLVWVGQTGAYAMAQASPFIHLRPGAVLVEGGRAALLRARETDDEALGAQAEPLLVGPGAGGVGLVIAVRVRGGRWADSAKMMSAARAAEAVDGVERAFCFMGTPANREEAAGLGLSDPAIDGAGPDDLVIAVQGDDAEAGLAAAEEVLDQAPAGPAPAGPPCAPRAAWPAPRATWP